MESGPSVACEYLQVALQPVPTISLTHSLFLLILYFTHSLPPNFHSASSQAPLWSKTNTSHQRN